MNPALHPAHPPRRTLPGLQPVPPAPQLESAYGSRPLDAAERERLLMEQLPQVRYVARRIHERLPAHVPLEDLVQAGVMGLIDAVNKYDPAKNAQLATYARFRIRGAILDSLRELDWGPRQLRRRAREIQEAEAQLQQQLGRVPTAAEVAAALDMPGEEYTRVRAELSQLEMATVNSPAVDTTTEAPDLDSLPSNVPTPFTLQHRGEIRELLAAVIDELPERERQLLNLYYFEELTMKEAGAVLGIGESRVCQIHAQVMKRLRRRLQEQMKLKLAEIIE